MLFVLLDHGSGQFSGRRIGRREEMRMRADTGLGSIEAVESVRLGSVALMSMPQEFGVGQSAMDMWTEELVMRDAACWVAVKPPPMDEREALRTPAPRRERDANGRVRPRVDVRPGSEVF